MSKKVKTRFAPSPTGYLHVGGARTALYAYLYAKAKSGEFVLRVEDTDQERSTQESIDMVLNDLKVLGISWDEGPEVGGDNGPYQQSKRLNIYKEHAERLLQSEKAFHCFCSDELLNEKREKAKKEGANFHYDGTCRSLTKEQVSKKLEAGETATVRFKVDTAEDEYVVQDAVRGEVKFPSDMIGDFIILRSDGMPVYNFCCVVDDALMGITHVLRAEEHLSNTLRQMMLYQAFQYPLPVFGHVSLILGEDKQKLSKRHGASSVSEYIEKGFLPSALNNYLTLLGWSSPSEKEILSIEETMEEFDLDRLKKSPAVFDEAKLLWMNATYIRSMDNIKLWEHLVPFLEKSGLKPSEEPLWAKEEWRDQALDLFKVRMETMLDGVAPFQFLSEQNYEINEAAKDALSWESSKKVIESWMALIKGSGKSFITVEDFGDIQNKVKEQAEVKGKFLFMPIRAAAIGVASGADVKELVPLISVETLLKRGAEALNCCS
ncbi:MAG: glutamate--tRNA ligase [Bdellovibrionales bacterium]